jgi:hypothetical protein
VVALDKLSFSVPPGRVFFLDKLVPGQVATRTTPVEDDDPVTVCGSVLAAGDRPAIRLTDFTQHWLRIDT